MEEKEEKEENKETNVVISFKMIGDWGHTIHILPRNKYIYITDKGDEVYSDAYVMSFTVAEDLILLCTS